MTEQIKWEYQVVSIGGVFGTKDELLQVTLNEMGEQGWEVVSVYTIGQSPKVTIVAKRPLTDTTRRRRSMP
jgi:cytochrome oxidase assembly protein ShyY1